MTRPAPSLRSHQRTLMALVAAMASGEAAHVRKILAAVTPGGGKSLLPVIAAHRLIEAGLVERVVWVVPRDSLRLQAEEAFADPLWRAAFGHALSVRAADNERDPARGLAGYVTTYQAVAAAPALHLAEARAHRTLLVVDEVHHLPVPGRPGADETSAEDAEAGHGPARCCPSWRRLPCACTCRGRWSGRTGGGSSGCPINPPRSAAGRSSTSAPRASRSSGTRGRRRSPSGRFCR
ncbi:DEAD/DEAH box helicase [Methylobacterium oryzae CBMB20]